MVKAIIAAAGLGTRLIPITLKHPKCLLEIHGKTIIERQVEILRDLGVNDVTVVIGYLGDMIRKILGDKVKYIENPIYSKTNSSYSLRLAIEESLDSFIYINSDLLFSNSMIKSLLASPKNSMLIDSSNRGSDDMFKVKIDKRRILELSKDLNPNESSGVAVGPVKLSGKSVRRTIEIIDHYINTGDKQRWFYSIVNEVSNQYAIFPVDIKGENWFEVDDLNDLNKCIKFYN